jgi:succinyl-CoA synthetase alpha subunit
MSILIDADTTFIVQGITGREAVNLTRECLDYGAGAKIVGGVTPRRKGREVHGVPGLRPGRPGRRAPRRPDRRLGRSRCRPRSPKDAVFEAIENGIKLVVIVPSASRAATSRRWSSWRRCAGARIIGPNCLGIIVPDVIKMGGIGGPAKGRASRTPRHVGVISRSGGMTTEMSRRSARPASGSPTAVSIGGDAIIGQSYAELMPLFEADEQTEAIVIYTEPGGRMEAQLAEWVAAHDSRLPIVAFMAGRFMDEMPGMSFGHAGTIVEGKEDTATEKIARLAEAGIVVAEEISEIPGIVKAKIAERKGASV